MPLRSRLSRFALVLATSAGLAASAGTASANPSETGFGSRADDAPGGVATHVDEYRPGTAGQGRKVG